MWGLTLLCSSLIRWTVAGFPSPQQFQLTISKEDPAGVAENPLGRNSGLPLTVLIAAVGRHVEERLVGDPPELFVLLSLEQLAVCVESDQKVISTPVRVIFFVSWNQSVGVGSECSFS